MNDAREAARQLQALSDDLAGRGVNAQVMAEGFTWNAASRVTGIEAAAFKVAYVLSVVAQTVPRSPGLGKRGNR